MLFSETPLPGVFTIDLERKEDERGFFARLWCHEELARLGLVSGLAQCSVSFNHRRGTLRGLHYQAEPHPETKLVRCISGAIFDVVLDLRPDSPSFTHWWATELSAHNRRQLYIPAGCAHGFQTLTDDAEVLYLISTPFRPELACGVRHDDPAFGIAWPLPVAVISARDLQYPPFAGAAHKEKCA